jgi:hypothetical protein
MVTAPDLFNFMVKHVKQASIPRSLQLIPKKESSFYLSARKITFAP